MNSREKRKASERRIEECAKKLPRMEPPETLWQRIEHELRATDFEAHHPAMQTSALREWWLRFSMEPRWTVAAYAFIIFLGIAAAVYVTSVRFGHFRQQMTDSTASEQLLFEAQSDIDQAMSYYEAGIAKLSVLAARNEKHLDAQFVALQKEKIASLRTAVEECKQALKNNRMNPDVQHYLLTAYIDLQGALQEMARKQN